ncbi:MAG: hypothetical protein COY38_05000 [Candidatus Aenigmarchaeota archaeon CG_4_10_14_0_8_um_filter_37_24]|nr:hypothetical protein [Candidatus Aenigmarchaeota archaeon]OIN86328.1 MAG: hypothetical protein AUJ50_03865 [Candidatus Aenigmarchaeota archaeon CG1_02_38_14]PIV68051.1 MAG: hypothetical protein COS07_05450 [Candidatus Aenigmarchaeota archaeon CG01_land_8_20_14_3_00_37_9]PIW40757.1 MAG: hypothetical protein COW21_05450 [Candidatus Aenigmarchaeota archaeon CG15_BIG_FIL_POST_REV_8_21_14_020_37_27]PIX51027.1 MAG: hypothetical protein COZ52_01060 [Candidatus Aenigmarchaeota archaeon CG_4_8_14_3_u
MTSEINQTELMTAEIKTDLEGMGFNLFHTLENGVMWGFDGSTKYFPRETYIRESNNGKPKIKMRLEKTNNGIILIINSEPFKQQNHLDRAQLEVKDILTIVKEYMNLI